MQGHHGEFGPSVITRFRVGPDVEHQLLPGEAFHREMARLRATGPLVPVLFGGTVVPLITTHADLDAAFRNDSELPAGLTYEHSIEPCQGVTFESRDGDEHNMLRTLSTLDLRARPVMAYVEQSVPAIANRVIDRFVRRREVDLVAEFTAVLPFAVFADKVGLACDLDRVPDYRDWSFGILSYPMTPEPALQCASALTRELQPLLTARRVSPQHDLISAVGAAARFATAARAARGNGRGAHAGGRLPGAVRHRGGEP